MAIDITVIVPIQDSLVEKAASEPLVAAKDAHDRKLKKNYSDCKEKGVEFIPIAIETFGAIHKEGEGQIKRISRQLSRNIGGVDSEINQHIFQKISSTLQRGNVALLSSRIPNFCPAEINGET